MNRARIAAAIVGLVIVGVIVYEVAFRGRVPQPPEEPVATVVSPKPATAEPVVTKAPGTESEPGTTPEPGKAKEPPKPEPLPEPKKQEPAGPPADSIVKAAEAQIKAGKKAEAQKLLSDALMKEPRPADSEPIKALLTKLNDELFFSKQSPLAITYVVKTPNDNLTKIASDHKTTIGLLQRLNGLSNPNMIRLEQKLKVIPGGFDVEVSKSRFLLTVTKGGIWVREFKVGLGKAGTTPVGTFVAGDCERNPRYTGVFPHVPPSDHKNNPLGKAWIGMAGAGKEYGIHGTWEPDSIGKEESKGCIRMRNEDVEWLFDLIVRGESKIAIKP